MKCFTFIEKVDKIVEYNEQEVRQTVSFLGFDIDRKFAPAYLLFHQARSLATLQSSVIKFDQHLSSMVVEYAEVKTALLSSYILVN